MNKEIINFVLDDVVFQLKTYHGIIADDKKIISLVKQEYSNFIKNEHDWNPDPFINKIIQLYTRDERI